MVAPAAQRALRLEVDRTEADCTIFVPRGTEARATSLGDGNAERHQRHVGGPRAEYVGDSQRAPVVARRNVIGQLRIAALKGNGEPAVV